MHGPLAGDMGPQAKRWGQSHWVLGLLAESTQRGYSLRARIKAPCHATTGTKLSTPASIFQWDFPPHVAGNYKGKSRGQLTWLFFFRGWF